MCYYQKKGMVHGDLKLENIPVRARGNMKVIDFSLSSRFMVGQKPDRFWDTLSYSAPEIFQWEKYECPCSGHLEPGSHSEFYGHRVPLI